MAAILIKLALLEFPAVLILLHWHRRGVRSSGLYKTSWAVTGGYVLWLLVVAATTALSRHPRFEWIGGSSIPANLFVVWPFFAIVLAFVLMVGAGVAQKGERGFVASANALMLIVWLTSVVAPN